MSISVTYPKHKINESLFWKLEPVKVLALKNSLYRALSIFSIIKDSDLSWSRFKNLSKLSKREKSLATYTQNRQLKTLYKRSFFLKPKLWPALTSKILIQLSCALNILLEWSRQLLGCISFEERTTRSCRNNGSTTGNIFLSLSINT